MTYKENRLAATALQSGATITIQGFGNSMTPILSSGQKVLVAPITEEIKLKKRDIVLCKVRGNYYLHLISARKGNQFQISNNHKHVNGWITIKNIFGVVTESL